MYYTGPGLADILSPSEIIDGDKSLKFLAHPPLQKNSVYMIMTLLTRFLCLKDPHLYPFDKWEEKIRQYPSARSAHLTCREGP